MSLSILVTGATGQVGGAVARELLARGHTVRALVRDADGDKARALAAAGASLVVGNLESGEGLREAADGVETAFLLTTPWTGVDVEVVQGKAMVDAAAEAGVGHFVFSSVASADRSTGIPHFDSKYEVEEHLAASGMNWTVTAPVYFYDNLLFPWNAESIAAGRFRQAVPADRPLQMIPVRDIGVFNALVIEGRDEYFGARIDIASDELTGTGIVGVLSGATGHSVAYEEQPLEELAAQSEDLALMCKWFDEVGYDVDIPALKARFPQVGWVGFSDWVGENRGAFEAQA